MIIAVFAFTGPGKALKRKLGELLEQRGHRILEDAESGALAEKARQAFREGDALVFIGACGIAVRAIAPLLQSKEQDPAVVVIDEQAQWVISLLSGHIGGANALTRELAALLGAQEIITTATDINHVFAVDTWARRNGLFIESMQKAKMVSVRLLGGETIPLASDWPIAGPIPKGITVTDGSCESPFGIVVTIRLRDEGPGCGWLRLTPPCVCLGIGCRKGASAEAIESAVEETLNRNRIDPNSVAAVGTIDIKRQEPGLVQLCERRGWAFYTYSAEQLMAASGNFSASAFVEAVTGADNVCERAAFLASRGVMLIPKSVYQGVTIAAAEGAVSLSFGEDW
jgi:cobalt-precorrin 5A hydrolase